MTQAAAVEEEEKVLFVETDITLAFHHAGLSKFSLGGGRGKKEARGVDATCGQEKKGGRREYWRGNNLLDELRAVREAQFFSASLSFFLFPACFTLSPPSTFFSSALLRGRGKNFISSSSRSG